jgi:membrane fusion protein, multidrug efflux system
MAAARDQAARVLRAESEATDEQSAREASAGLADRLRAHAAEEAKRKPAETPAAPPVDKPAAPGAAANSAVPKSGKRRFVLMGIVALLALAAAGYGVHYILVGRFFVSTDDAYVRANNTMLGARVTGHIAAILPGDNTLVHAGDVILKIDDGDYRIAVDAARTKIATQEATIARIGRQIAAFESAVEQAQANVVAAEAVLKRAGLDYDRQQALSNKGFASRATFEQSEAGRDQGAAALRAAQAAYDAARDNVDVTKAQQAEAQAQLAELKTSLAKAERDLGFASVRAPVDGIFSNRLVNTGDFVAVGQRLGNVVPLDDVYIDANFKETQLQRIRPGQGVTISVDAYGHRKFAGIVDSISPAAGSVFTLLPPDNATGNFTKIVQRLPVRVRVPKEVARQNLLRAGMSVYATVDTTTGAADADSDVDLDSPVMIHPQ